jgi:hypothetical protein
LWEKAVKRGSDYKEVKVKLFSVPLRLNVFN